MLDAEHFLWTPAALSFLRLNAKAIQSIGQSIPIKTSYVPHEMQAVLGTTNDNGWGLAFDLKDDCSQAMIDWLQNNAPQFYFVTTFPGHWQYIARPI